MDKDLLQAHEGINKYDALVSTAFSRLTTDVATSLYIKSRWDIYL